MSYSLEALQDGCYPGTAVLINKFDIRDEEKLRQMESVVVTARNAQWLNAPAAKSFDFEHYKSIHRYLFGDLYDWAGELRTVNMQKKGTRFCPAADVPARAEAIFRRLEECRYFKGLCREAFADEICSFYMTTNELHPFREGNGRTQRAFITQLVQNAGYKLDFADMDADLLMIATIQAAHGVSDALRELFLKFIRE